MAVRSNDFRGFSWWPESEGMARWRDLHLRVTRSNGGTPDAGRRLRTWAREAGFDVASPSSDRARMTAGTWCFTSEQDVGWWSSLWAERLVQSKFRSTALKDGLASEKELHEAARAWEEWGASPDAWFLAWHGELLYRV